MREKTMKRAAGLMAAVMLLGLAGCGSQETTESSQAQESDALPVSSEEAAEPKEPVTLEWYYRGNGQQEDTEMVEQRVNELLKTYPGLEHVTINLNCSTSSEYQEHVTLAQSAGQQIDILNSVSLDFYEQVENGSYMPLDDLISDELRAELPEWLWKMGSVDGKIYMVPNYQQACNMGYLFTPKEYMDKYGDYDKIVSVLTDPDSSYEDKMAVMEEYLMAVREGEGDGKYLPSLPSRVLSETGTQGFYFRDYFDVVSGDFIVEAGSGEVTYKYATDMARQLCALSAQWYDAGIIHPDVLTVEASELRYENMLNPTSWILSYNGAIGDPETVAETYKNDWGFEVVAIPTQQQYYIQNSWAAGGNGISSTCEHPEEAIKFIEALTTGTEKGKEIYNTMVFGIEGVHYTRDENDPDRIETLEYSGAQGGIDTSYAAMKWIIGNTFYAYKNQAVSDENSAIALEVNEGDNTITSDLVGFVADTDSVSVQLDQIKAVTSEYRDTLLQGVLGEAGWEACYNEYIEKLKVAGMDEVIAEFQRQLDEFLANQ
ncbi:ABC transporter substrate-binding protein [Candidatus Acetatifactor stercoripullorum]|uniref:ABC transporter substrate-binding protein n=1 Tax=Candidatus Acetatifactor stercoripullorum TaxID=2838414 RepID=UPI00298D99BD|nr:DUF3502 domain-containing protein [Candidatus Acetatifactor stercoripullorum]